MASGQDETKLTDSVIDILEETKQNESDRDEETEQIVNDLITSLNNKKLTEKQQEIVQYLGTIGLKHIQNMEQKDFRADVSDHCNDTKLKGPLGKLYKQIIAHQFTAVIALSINLLNDQSLNEHKDTIIQWVIDNKDISNFNALEKLTAEQFADNISEHIGDNNIKPHLLSLYEMIHNEHAPNDMEEKTNVKEETNGHEINDERTLLFSKIVDENKKLNDKKGKIMEWFAKNQERMVPIGRKPFSKEVSDYCGDTKLKGPLGKLWKEYDKQMKEIPAVTGRASQVQKDEEAKDEIPLEDSAKKPETNNTEPVHEEEPQEESKYDVSPDGVNKDKADMSDSDAIESSDEDGDDRPVYGEQMPTYIHRAIWFRSDDEHLERLVDQAVKLILKQTTWWKDPKFVTRLYDSSEFENNVEGIATANIEFFQDFVKKTFRRELLLEAMQEEESKKEDPDDKTPAELPSANTQRNIIDCTHVVHFKPVHKKMEEKDGYHIFRENDAALANNTYQMNQNYKQRELYVDHNQNSTQGFEWAVWKNKSQKTKLAQIVQQNNQKTYGYWDILNSEKSKKSNKGGKAPGVPLEHLNILFELLRTYYRQRIKQIHRKEKKGQNVRMISSSAFDSQNDLETDPIRDTYCSNGEPRKVEKGIDIYIHEDIDTPHHYKLTWWNCKKRKDCNAIAIKNMKQENAKEKYYMRFNVNDLKHKQTEESKNVEWLWYDNNRSIYDRFADYQYPAEQSYKKGLLHKQLEAMYQANIHANFPWHHFTKFNNAQITHLAPALESNTGSKRNSGYLLRFTRLSFGDKNKKEDEHETKVEKMQKREKRDSLKLQIDQSKVVEVPAVNIILSMEQIGVNIDDETLFPRNVQRLKDGKNSLKSQYCGSEPFVNDWLETYQLATEGQQKYFWSYILSIATKIKHIDIEIENQLVTIPTSTYAPAVKHSLFSNTTGEVAQEQQDALLYKGFLVPPVLGESVTDAIQNKANATMEQVRESIELQSKTRHLQKYKVKEQGLVNEEDEPFVFVHSPNDAQFLENQAVMFRFAEIVRKYIIESKHLRSNSSLWPYYRNYSHIQDHGTYHTLVNRFNLSLMFNKETIFKLFETAFNDESVGCLTHMSCNDYTRDTKDETEEKEIAIRHRRKYAATLLLQKWNTLRNLNLLRQQLVVVLNSIDDEKKSQEEMMEDAEKYKWKKEIKEINGKLKKNIKGNKDGWQFLSEYGNLKDNNPIEISIKQYPFFKYFCKFLYKKVKAEIGQAADYRESSWFRQFKDSWHATPQWWSFKYDLILLELALQYDVNHVQYVEALKGDKSFDYRMRLKDHTNYLEFTHFCAQSANILHRLAYITNEMVDGLICIQPSLVAIRVPRPQRAEYDPTKESFIFSDYEKATHEKYVQNEPKEIGEYRPESKQNKGNPANHEKYRSILNPVVTDIVKDLRENWPIEEAKTKEKEGKQAGAKTESKTEMGIELGVVSENKPLMSDHDEGGLQISTTDIMEKKEEEKQPELLHVLPDDDDEEDDEEADEDEPRIETERKKTTKKKKKETVDPFISRDLDTELYEVVNAFDMIKYGEHMAHLLINEIKEFGMDELWNILGVVMEAIPFGMAEKILYSEMETLERGTPKQLEALCLQMVDGTNWRVSAALRMAEYFQELADDDILHEAEWQAIGDKFEDIAHESVHDIESDHLLYLLLTIPLYDTSEPMNIIKLALEQKRLGFLNNDRILSVIDHIWQHGPSIAIEQELKGEELSFSDLLPILTFTPFKFYITPIGYNYTLSILFLLYLLYVLSYSFTMVKGGATLEMEIVLWVLNVGYILYELSEWADKGREYFSVSGLMNVWDIMISVVWIILFVITIVVNPNESEYLDVDRQYLHEHKGFHEVLIKSYTILFGFQIFLLSTRFLTLFQNTEYLGGLLKIVQMMSQEIAKFFSVAIVVIAAFSFGFYFIYGLVFMDEVNPEDVPEGFLPTILFTFELFIGGGTNADSDIGALFTVFLTLIGHLILTNLLIALMTTKYEIFQETAQAEVHFMVIETAIDLAHRDRLMPPPLNILIYPLGLFIHIWLTLGAVFSLCCCRKSRCCNCYSRINRGTYLCLDTFYCGCNKKMARFYASKRKETDAHNVVDDIVQRELYNLSCFELFLEVSGLRYVINKLIGWCWREACFCDCIRIKSCRRCQNWCRKCRERKKNPDTSLNAYHKGCYNCIKLRVKDGVDQSEQTTVRGITMKEYITTYEEKRGSKLHLDDTILLKHLTVDTLLCNYCYQPYLEHQVDKSLLPPFRVLLDIISCVAFLFTAWIPLILLFTLLTLYEYLRDLCDSSIKSKDSEHGNKYEEFDREYFPHPDKTVVSLD